MPTLAQLLRAAAVQGPPLEARAVCAITSRVCAALARPHGELAPSAIHLGWAGSVTLPDRARERGAALVYMAPERLAGVAPDDRSDVFALGLLLFELATGRALPRDGFGRAARATELACELPIELAEVVERATAADPHDRYAGPRELATWLSLAEQECGGPMSDPELADWMARRFGPDLAAAFETARDWRRQWIVGAAIGLLAFAAVLAPAFALAAAR
jgi:hypothetical protein